VRCPYCGFESTKVMETRVSKDGLSIRRRRECVGCGKRFTTLETVELSLPMVVKKDGRREPFNREKILKGLQKAFEKRPVSIEQQEQIVSEVEKFLLSLGEREVSSKVIGEKVIELELIKEVDEVAYVRFASVYRQFKDLSDFLEELRRLIGKNEGQTLS